MTRLLPVILAMSALPGEGDPPTSPRTPPTAPAAATATFRTLHRFRMEPIAAEPLVFDPVAAAYDEDGRLYVAEMSDYPHVEAKNDKPFSENTLDPPVGRLKLPVDRDGDGTFDTATVLADKLSWPTGLAIWKGGAFVAATPAIWCIKDADGDGRVEVRERAYEGPRKFNIQAAMNNLRWGLDYAIYGAGSGNGGEVRRSDRRRRRPSRSSGGISSSTPRRGRSRRSRAGHGSVTPSTIGEIGSSATSATRPSMSSCPPATWRGIPDWRPPGRCTTPPGPGMRSPCSGSARRSPGASSAPVGGPQTAGPCPGASWSARAI